MNAAIGWGRVLPAPAKINLFLHVVGRRPDGYHLLQTAFRFVDRCDELRLLPRNDGEVLRVSEVPGVPAEQDLCVKAARLLQHETGTSQGVTIELTKRLPMGGGLGGGSSDAATVLLALNRLWSLDLPRERLQKLGLMLGADVPVFVFGHSAFAEGIGERSAAARSGPGLVCRDRAGMQCADRGDFRLAGFDTKYESPQNGGLFIGLAEICNAAQ